jgi:hypothetical protein
MNEAIRAHRRRVGNMAGSQYVTWRDQIPAAAAVALLQNFDDAAGFHRGGKPFLFPIRDFSAVRAYVPAMAVARLDPFVRLQLSTAGPTRQLK